MSFAEFVALTLAVIDDIDKFRVTRIHLRYADRVLYYLN
jgi:hypothetical protein